MIFERGLTNLFITAFLTKHSRTFQGTFSADSIPQKLSVRKRFSIVCNLSNENAIGTHFVTIIAFSHYVLYIDSLGLPCFVRDIAEFLNVLRRPVFYNLMQIQHLDSSFCGFYALLYVLYFETRCKIKLEFSAEQLLANDTLCVEYIMRIKRCLLK
jgi:hypothetical protein